MEGKVQTFVLLCSIFFATTKALQPNVAEWDQGRKYGPLRWLVMNAGRSPGLKARITSYALNYATSKAIEDLAASAVGQRIPDESGTAGDADYWISGMTITGLNRPYATIELETNKGLVWTASKLGLSANGNWRYAYSLGWFTIRDSGSFDIGINDVSFRLGIALGMDSGGRPTIQTNGCWDNIGSVSVTFSGGLSWIYNLFRGLISNAIKKVMSGKLCDILNKVVNQDAQQALSKIPVTVNIANTFLLDYRFITSPLFTSQYMETKHKGEVTWMSSPVNPPFIAPPLASTTDTSRMFYLFVSDYVFNSLSYAAHTNGLLQYNLTQKDLPSSQKQALNTTCTNYLCIGSFLPKLQQYYPNCIVELSLRTTTAPEMSINASYISVKSEGNIVFEILQPNRTLVPDVITLNATMSTTIGLKVKNQRIYAKVLDLIIKATIDKDASQIKDMSEYAINFIINNAVRIFVRPELDKLGEEGLPLPVTDNLKFTNPEITLGNNTLIISTDVTYG